MRIVLDTGIFVSALISKNTPPDMLYNAWRKRRFDLITSDVQLEEIERVFFYKKLERFIQKKEALLMIDTIGSVAEILVDLPVVDLSPDPNDNMIIATALKGRVDYLVSGDKKDLLSLKTVQNIPIITARKAVAYLGIVDS
ncbi:MAG: putative toxin-antitoxin system toxin component, PIN family [Thiotrichaceae bacterium]